MVHRRGARQEGQSRERAGEEADKKTDSVNQSSGKCPKSKTSKMKVSLLDLTLAAPPPASPPHRQPNAGQRAGVMSELMNMEG